MKKFPARGLFVTGTNTEVGKTFVTALIATTLRARGHQVGVYKPVASGCQQVNGRLTAEDAVQLATAADCLDQLDAVCPQRFAAPLAPYLAARAEGRKIDDVLLQRGLEFWADRCEIVLVEGAGGLMSPLTDQIYNATLAGDFGYPLVVVAPNELGVLNQSLQTLIAAKANGLNVAAVLLNDVVAGRDPSCESNLAELRQHCAPIPVYAVAHQARGLSEDIDWYALSETHLDRNTSQVEKTICAPSSPRAPWWRPFRAS